MLWGGSMVPCVGGETETSLISVVSFLRRTGSADQVLYLSEGWVIGGQRALCWQSFVVGTPAGGVGDCPMPLSLKLLILTWLAVTTPSQTGPLVIPL